MEQIATIDVPLQNGGTKTQEENPDPSKTVCSLFRIFASCNIIDKSLKIKYSLSYKSAINKYLLS